MENNDDEQKFGIEGVYIPSELLFNPRLSKTDMILFGFLRKLWLRKEGCTASNRYLGSLLDLKASTISDSISRLVKYGYAKIKTTQRNDGTKTINRHIYENKDYKRIYEPLIRHIHGVFTEKNQEEIKKFHEDYSIDIVDKIESEVAETLCEKNRYPLPKKPQGYAEKNDRGIEKTGRNTYKDTNRDKNNNGYESSSKKTEEDMRGAQSQACPSDEDVSRNHCSNILGTNSTQTEKDKSLDKSSSIRDKFRIKKIDLEPYRDSAEILYKLWQGFGLVKTHKRKDMNDLLSLLAGTHVIDNNLLVQSGLNLENRSFSYADIQKSITNFATYSQNKRNVKKLTIREFIYNEYNTKIPSSFLHNLLNDPSKKKNEEELPEETDDEWPITSMIKSNYKKKILQDVEINFTLADEKNFRKARDFVIEFIEKNRKRMIGLTRPMDLGGELVSAWADHMDGRLHEMRTGFLACRTAGKVLFDYLMEKGQIKNYHTSRAGF